MLCVIDLRQDMKFLSNREMAENMSDTSIPTNGTVTAKLGMAPTQKFLTLADPDACIKKWQISANLLT